MANEEAPSARAALSTIAAVADLPGGNGKTAMQEEQTNSPVITDAPQKGHSPSARWTLQAPQWEHG